MNFDQIEIALESFQTNEASTGRNPKDYKITRTTLREML